LRLTDRDLERVAPRLGQAAADRLDLEQVAGAVARRLADAGGASRPLPTWRWLAAAAGVVLAAGAGFLTFGTDGAPPTIGRPAGLTPSLLDLSASELRVVLDSLDQSTPMLVSSDLSLDDLDSEQLATLLALMEG
jgi:hypothetical protein